LSGELGGVPRLLLLCGDEDPGLERVGTSGVFDFLEDLVKREGSTMSPF
jgi:hypothetical protein